MPGACPCRADLERNRRPALSNPVVPNDHEFIATSDESATACLTFDGRREAEMPDKRNDRLMAKDTFIFTARYTDGTTVGLWAHPKCKSRKRGLKSVEPVAEAVSKLPTFIRATLDHVVIHGVMKPPSARASEIMLNQRSFFEALFCPPGILRRAGPPRLLKQSG